MDWVLQSVVAASDNAVTPAGETHLPVTIAVGGMLIAGDLVSGELYLSRALRESYEEMVARNPSLALTLDGVRDGWLKLRARLPEDDVRSAFPKYIHLRHARAYTPGGSLGTITELGWWRGRLESVDGFSFGARF